ncbi:MAG: ADP-ribosylglycohydrolase family protein [Cytophagia bacterium]|nr:ADP-ribosylglycohydrolase family protein [Cytophagia bacterium]
MKKRIANIESCFLGLAIGDALGVPVEFRNRNILRNNPITTMTGYGCWDQPAGTWSDDSSLAFCTAESLVEGYDLHDMGKRFVRWRLEGYWGAHGKVFDIGGTTRVALDRIVNGEDPLYSGEFEEESNGNGSLMRIIPASLYFHNSSNQYLMERMREISGVTHRHFRSVFSCFIFSKFVAHLFLGLDKIDAFLNAIDEIKGYIATENFNAKELDLFNRVLSGQLPDLPEEKIYSSGYVLHTLEASIWCFLNSGSFKEAVLKAVNLGGDTDTTACVTGALAGLYYGKGAIPSEWIDVLARKEDIILLAGNFQKSLDKVILAES